MSFKILKKDKKTKARLGVLKTAHGTIKTPAYVMVATRGQIKCLKPSDIRRTKTQIVIANTYHLWPEAIKYQKLNIKNYNSGKKSFLLEKLGTKLPTMTDSGGFQVFSLAFGTGSKARKIFPEDEKLTGSTERKYIRITNRGVYFKVDGVNNFLGPELSIKIQEKLGADIIFAFDECTSYFDSFKYNKAAMDRTHRWAKRCLKARPKLKSQNSKVKQLLFGIVQGGRYKNLRIQSAKFIGSLPFDGFGIGGSFGKEEMAPMLKWVIPHLPEEKPRHLLGIGRIEDIFKAVENGVDLFDCVIPTREARHGRIWTNEGYYDIRKSKFAKDKRSLGKNCGCPACSPVGVSTKEGKKGIIRARLYELFKEENRSVAHPIRQAQSRRYATIHNVWFFNDLIEKIRDAIEKDRFDDLKKEYLKRLRLAR